MVPWLGSDDDFPAVDTALAEPNGLLAAGGDLSTSRLIAAYRRGIFPWYNAHQPILWWSPDPRTVLIPSGIRVTRSLAKTLRNRPYEVRTDTAFRTVIERCAAPRAGQDGTWITRHMAQAYCALHEEGIAHSIETWIDGELAGGLYGVALGRAFFGESMFTRATDASKIALVWLARQLARWRFGVIDCQMHSAHLASFGAQPVSRADFTRQLRELVNYPAILGPWEFDRDLAE